LISGSPNSKGLSNAGLPRSTETFSAVADDIADIKCDMATKEQAVTLHAQVNSIETERRGMKHTKLQARVEDLEEEVFGESRA
jgi:uncharacterized membrane protein